MLGGQLEQLVARRAVAVGVEDLAQHARRGQVGHAGQVDRGLGVAGPPQLVRRSDSRTRLSGSCTASDLSRSASSTLKSAVFAPMPSASVRTAANGESWITAQQAESVANVLGHHGVASCQVPYHPGRLEDSRFRPVYQLVSVRG